MLHPKIFPYSLNPNGRNQTGRTRPLRYPQSCDNDRSGRAPRTRTWYQWCSATETAVTPTVIIAETGQRRRSERHNITVLSKRDNLSKKKKQDADTSTEPRLTCHGPSILLERTTAPSRCDSTSIASPWVFRNCTARSTNAPSAIGMGYHFVGVDQAFVTFPTWSDLYYAYARVPLLIERRSRDTDDDEEPEAHLSQYRPLFLSLA